MKRIEPLSASKHIFTHKEWHMQGWLAVIDDLKYENDIWCDQQDLMHTYAIASAFHIYKDIALQALSGAENNES